VTEQAARGGARCEGCGRRFARAATGRPRRWCSAACRQRAYQDRVRGADALDVEDRLVEARDALAVASDRLAVLAGAVDDVERDLAAGRTDPDELRGALEWLLEAARAAVAGPLPDTAGNRRYVN
jgi:hypothetical protein